MPLLHTALLVHRDTSSYLSLILYCSAYFSVLLTFYTPHSFCVPHPCNILHPLPLPLAPVVFHICIPSVPDNFTVNNIHSELSYFAYIYIYTVLNSLGSLRYCFLASVTSTVSSANYSWFISNLTTLAHSG